MSAASEVLEAPRAVRTVPDRVLGAIGGVMVLLAIYVAFAGGPRDGASALVNAPMLAIVQPADGTILEGPLVLAFDVQAEMQPQAGGWGVGGYHIHLHLDGLELMPGPTDVRPASSGYQWVVGPLEPGTHTLQLYWSDENHRRVESGASEVVVIESR